MSFLKCKSMDKFFLLTLWLPPRWKTTTMTMTTTTTTGRVGEKQIMQLVLRLATSSRQQQQADLLESCFWNSLAAATTTNASSFSRSKAFHPTGATATKTKVQQPRGAANQLVDCKLVCWLLLLACCPGGAAAASSGSLGLVGRLRDRRRGSFDFWPYLRWVMARRCNNSKQQTQLWRQWQQQQLELQQQLLAQRNQFNVAYE